MRLVRSRRISSPSARDSLEFERFLRSPRCDLSRAHLRADRHARAFTFPPQCIASTVAPLGASRARPRAPPPHLHLLFLRFSPRRRRTPTPRAPPREEATVTPNADAPGGWDVAVRPGRADNAASGALVAEASGAEGSRANQRGTSSPPRVSSSRHREDSLRRIPHPGSACCGVSGSGGRSDFGRNLESASGARGLRRRGVYGLGGGWDHELVGTAMLYSRELVTAIASSVGSSYCTCGGNDPRRRGITNW